jgi:leader peptidase (prepilin peptidase) / N-methyltransferase
VLAAAVFMFLLGAVLGSFISVVAHRVPGGESIVRPRSRCPACGEAVAAYDNVPVVSWLLLRGRCRHCGGRISAAYPLVELTLAVGFVAALFAFEDEPAEILLACGLLCTLLAITLTDLEYRVIPNRILLASAVFATLVVVATQREGVDERAIAAACSFAFLFVVALAYPRGMGMGDVKLAAVMGLYLGRAVAPALLLAFAAGALYGAVLIARHGSEARKRAVPFGPFLALGGVAGLFAGDPIVDWYLDTFFDG